MIPAESRFRRALPPSLLVLGVVLVAVNLRPAIAGFGPLLPQIQADLHLSAASAGLLTAIPLLCWGLLAPLAPLLTRHWSSETLILALIGVLGVGALLRAGPSLGVILTGTVLVGAGIALVNVLLPSLVRREFPAQVGLMLGVYTLAVVGGAALASAVAVPLQAMTGGSWRASLGTWAGLAGVGALAWLPTVFGRPHHQADAVPVWSELWRNPYAWPVTLFMGTQALVFFTWLAWLPRVWHDQGLSAGVGGGLLSLGNLVQLPFALLIPILAGRVRQPFVLVMLAVALVLAGLLWLLYVPAAPLVGILLLGAGSGSTFPLALYLISVRAAFPAQVAQLSGLAQGVGYLLAAGGPVAFGALHDRAGGWHVPLWFLIGVTGVVLLSGWWACRPAQTVGGQPVQGEA
ncbi:MFS transporter [Deinococcus sp. KSM4-11]|uniref:CynX/NimT family MFS transporter n=1 Tax=Deinococcus sp. KSM4-11 TaxID=2568654 RepID=UPI001454D655|nr:MFS transporter [Deinococcus sp. KSM4-11]